MKKCYQTRKLSMKWPNFKETKIFCTKKKGWIANPKKSCPWTKESLYFVLKQTTHELKACNISSIYNKASQNVFINYQGMFRLTVIRNILDWLIYNDIQLPHCTDSNVGARKQRCIWDNLLALNAIYHFVIRGNEESCEPGEYDSEKCFDSLWMQDCINNFYDAGCNDDHLVLFHLMTNNTSFEIKTSQGITRRVNIPNILMQGGVFWSTMCTTSMNKLDKYAYSTK